MTDNLRTFQEALAAIGKLLDVDVKDVFGGLYEDAWLAQAAYCKRVRDERAAKENANPDEGFEAVDEALDKLGVDKDDVDNATKLHQWFTSQNTVRDVIKTVAETEADDALIDAAVERIEAIAGNPRPELGTRADLLWGVYEDAVDDPDTACGFDCERECSVTNVANTVVDIDYDKLRDVIVDALAIRDLSNGRPRGQDVRSHMGNVDDALRKFQLAQALKSANYIRR